MASTSDVRVGTGIDVEVDLDARASTAVDTGCDLNSDTSVGAQAVKATGVRMTDLLGWSILELNSMNRGAGGSSYPEDSMHSLEVPFTGPRRGVGTWEGHIYVVRLWRAVPKGQGVGRRPALAVGAVLLPVPPGLTRLR